MKMKPKEILKNKSDKIIDLIIDEVENGGEKEITASFTKNALKYELTVKINVSDVNKFPVDIDDFDGIDGIDDIEDTF